LVLLAAAALLVAGCGTGPSSSPETSGAPQAVGQNDVNPVDPSRLRDGGELRWPIEDYPAQFNMLQGDATNGDIPPVVQSMMPTPVLSDATGSWSPNPAYVESFQLSSTAPQKVTYRLNRAARWSDGSPITWEDYRSQWEAMNGHDPAFNVLSTAGYANVSDITRGADDDEFTATFDPPYAEWKNLFQVLYPRSMTSNPDEFNRGWKDAPKVTAGPFRVGRLDPTGKTVTVVRDPAWWGEKPRLDRIVFRFVDSGQQRVDALANGELDFTGVAADLNTYQRARSLPGIVLRRATLPNYRTIVFNGSGNSVLADPELRKALMRGIDRRVITRALVGQLLPDAEPLGNHLYVRGFPGYQDNASMVSYDPDAARRQLDALGWRLDGNVRRRGGVELRIRDVVPAGTAASTQEAQLVQKQLAEIGVNVQIQTVDSHGFFDQHVVPGDFDITHYAQIGTGSPVTDALSSFTIGPQAQQNFGRIGDDRINQLLTAAAGELDDARRQLLVNQADQELWNLGHSLPLYRRPSIVAVRDKLANFGNVGLASIPYARIGWLP
jgi:peptide/nickel transport system substrate-binding protein